MIAARHDPLPHHHLNPAGFSEQFLVLAEDPAGFTEQFDLLLEAFWDRHIGALAPERAVAAIGDFIVEDQEVADLFHVGELLIVEFGHVALADPAASWQHPDQPQHGALNQVDAGRFERLHEPARKPHRHTVAMPLPPTHAGGVADEIGLGQCFAFNRSQQPVERGLLIEIAAAIDDPVALTVLQRNAPLPSGIMGNRAGIRHRRADAGGLDRDRVVTRQIMRPIIKPGVQRAFDQQRTKAGAIDEQIAFDPPVSIEH